jgi:hypothetical protein
MTQTGHFKESKNTIDHIYSRLEIKGIRAPENNKDLVKEKLKKLGFVDEEKEIDEDENKKIAKSLNIDYDNIETIDPMALMGDNPDLDTLDFKNMSKEDEDEDENEDINIEENEKEEDIMEEEEEEEEKDNGEEFDESEEENNKIIKGKKKMKKKKKKLILVII